MKSTKRNKILGINRQDSTEIKEKAGKRNLYQILQQLPSNSFLASQKRSRDLICEI